MAKEITEKSRQDAVQSLVEIFDVIEGKSDSVKRAFAVLVIESIVEKLEED